MTRLYGWAPRGRRLVDKVPHGHWKTATFLAALRNDRINAPCVFDGPINGERFLAYVEQFVVPTLKGDDIVVPDNLGSHKGKAARNAIKAAGARLLFLPKHSDLNPRRAADLRGNRSHRRPPRRMILHVLEDQPNGACAHFG
jgi:putative transposase